MALVKQNDESSTLIRSSNAAVLHLAVLSFVYTVMHMSCMKTKWREFVESQALLLAYACVPWSYIIVMDVSDYSYLWIDMMSS